MYWTSVIEIAAFMVLVGVMCALLMILRDRLLTRRRARMITQVKEEVVHEYLPKLEEVEVRMTVTLMDKIFEKIPGMMETTFKTMKKLEEENDKAYSMRYKESMNDDDDDDLEDDSEDE